MGENVTVLILYLFIFSALAVVLSLGAIIGDNVPWRGRRARTASTCLALVSLAFFVVLMIDWPIELPMAVPFYLASFAITWRARIWWQDRELERRRTLRADRRRARIQWILRRRADS